MQYRGYGNGGDTLRNKKDHIEYLKLCARLWRSGDYCTKLDGEQQAQVVETKIATLQAQKD